MNNYFEKKFMDEMEKKSATTALLLYGVTEPLAGTKDDLKKHLDKISDAGYRIIYDMDGHLYEVAGESSGLDDYLEASEMGFYNKTVDKMVCITEIYTKLDLNYIRETFEMPKEVKCGLDRGVNTRIVFNWAFMILTKILLGIFEESR